MSKKIKPVNSNSVQFQLFFVCAAVILLVNLLIANDYITFWNGAETDLILATQNNLSIWAFAPKLKMESLLQIFDFQHFWFRLPSVMMFLFGLLGFWFFGKKIFGSRTTLNAILVMGSSLILPNVSKLATGDAWLFGSQLLAVTTLILYLKKPDNKVLFVHFLFVIIGSLVHALSMFIFLVVLFFFWKRRHPQGNNLGAKASSWLIPLIILLVGLFGFDINITSNSGSYFSTFSQNPLEYFAYMLLGMLPWMAFLPAAILDMVSKFKRKEELSILTFGWLLAAVFSLSIGLQAIFAFLIAKQVQAYFLPNYPYKNWVKSIGAIQAIVAFVGGMILMLNGFYALEMEGFRLAMALGASFWIPCFLGIVGLYGNNNRMLMGGMALSGLFVTFVFWARVVPVVEGFRSMPKEMIKGESEYGKERDLYLIGSDDFASNVVVYGNSIFKEVKKIKEEELEEIDYSSNTVFVIKDSLPNFIDKSKIGEIDTIQGWSKNIFEVETWLKWKNK